MDSLQTRLQQSLSDRYHLDQELGRGGMAVVFLAEDLKHHRQVAIKVLKPDLLPSLGAERFLREIEIAAGLAHPNILPLHDSGEADGLLFYVMPYVQGETLRDRLGRERQLPLDDALHITAEIADALGYAHSLGLVHRDVKPENILFQAGHAVVSDFGIARAVSRAGGEQLTESGLAVGTVAYMSPEQASGAKDLDARSDIYSLGCVLYEMLAGEPPFLTPSIPAPARAGRPDLLARRETIPRALNEVVAKALARVPADRYTTTQQFKEALERAFASPRTSGTWAALRRASARRRWRLVAAGTLLLILLLVPPGPRRALWRLLGGASGPPMVTLAVLPFENLTGDTSQDYFSDGLTEEMTSQLGRLHPEGLAVIARTSAERYKHTTKPIAQIGRELGAQYILEGSARREADTVRVTGELIRARDGTAVWSDSYQRAMAGVLALESDVARAIANALTLVLLPQERARLADTHAVNPDAYDDYLKGLDLLHTLTTHGLEAAQRYFERALQEDSTYALAYSGLSYVWSARQQMGDVPPSEAAPRIRAAAERAVALDSTLAEAYFALGNTKAWTDWDWAGAEADFRKALALDPSLAEARGFYSHVLLVLGKPRQALAQARRSVELDPLNEMVHLIYAVVLYGARRYDDALAQANIVIRTAPLNPAAMKIRAGAYEGKRLWGEAFAAERARVPRADAGGLAAFDSGYAQGGFRGAMRLAADTLASRRRFNGRGAVGVADFFLLAGDTARAFEWMERAYAEHDPNLPYVGALPLYDPIRNSPHFRDLLRRMGLPWISGPGGTDSGSG